jgi:hypothetical protein
LSVVSGRSTSIRLRHVFRSDAAAEAVGNVLLGKPMQQVSILIAEFPNNLRIAAAEAANQPLPALLFRFRHAISQRPSGQDFTDDLAMHISQAEVATGMTESQPLMVESQDMKNGRLQIVDMNAVVDRVEADIIGGTQCNAGFDAAPGHPHAECLRMMVTAE